MVGVRAAIVWNLVMQTPNPGHTTSIGCIGDKIKKTHRDNLYFSPTDVQDIMARLPERIAAMVWTQAVHGMNAKEMLLDGCKVDGAGLQIYGKKHEHRDRIVPLIVDPAPLAIQGYSLYFDWLRRASLAYDPARPIGTHDLRRCCPPVAQHGGHCCLPHPD
jgi:hypothetical protein